MTKPKKKSKEAYDYHELIHYIEKKYKYDTRDFGGKYTGKKVNEKAEYLDFWHWFVEDSDIHNGCYSYINFDAIEDEDTEEFVKTILKDIRKEFDPKNKMSELKVWIEW